jgi:hypothetical protein
MASEPHFRALARARQLPSGGNSTKSLPGLAEMRKSNPRAPCGAATSTPFRVRLFDRERSTVRCYRLMIRAR